MALFAQREIDAYNSGLSEAIQVVNGKSRLSVEFDFLSAEVNASALEESNGSLTGNR